MAMDKSVALVTGASSGIGAAYARRLSLLGHHLILVARRRHKLEELASTLDSAEVMVADLAVEPDLQRIEERIRELHGLGFLVNNAGFGTLGSFLDSDMESQDRMHRVHILATMRLTHAAIRGMVACGSGSIVNVSSVAAFFHTPHNVSYGSTKAWIKSFTESLFVELRSIHSPVRVQALCPGFTHTEFHDVMGFDKGQTPASLWYSAEFVVAESLKGLSRNQVIVIPGWRYRLLVALQNRLPRALAHRVAIAAGRRVRQPHASRPV